LVCLWEMANGILAAAARSPMNSSISGGANATADDIAPFGVEIHPPLFTVFPAAGLCFYGAYFVVWPALLPRTSFSKTYARLNRVANLCFRANLGSMVHSTSATLLMFIVLATDVTMRTERMHQHYNAVGYVAMCITLGYFALSVPWSCHVRYREAGGPLIVPLPMLFHHVLVVCGALLYAHIWRRPPPYMMHTTPLGFPSPRRRYQWLRHSASARRRGPATSCAPSLVACCVLVSGHTPSTLPTLRLALDDSAGMCWRACAPSTARSPSCAWS
jgi:hypothetical protein